jgi:hypothetical protein
LTVTEIVMFRAPVQVHVDMETKTVVRVVVGDEEAELDELISPAAEVAMGAEWPNWEFQ